MLHIIFNWLLNIHISIAFVVESDDLILERGGESYSIYFVLAFKKILLTFVCISSEFICIEICFIRPPSHSRLAIFDTYVFVLGKGLTVLLMDFIAFVFHFQINK